MNIGYTKFRTVQQQVKLMSKSDQDINSWLEERSAQLLEELGQVPFTDDHDYRKLKLIRQAMKEASVEMFKRAISKTKSNYGSLNPEKILHDD